MPFVQFRERLYQLRAGENLVGADPTSSIRIPEVKRGHRLTISVESVGSFAWAVGDGTTIALNGRPLAQEPIPLFDGDLLSLDGSTLIFVDDEIAARR